MNVTVLGLCGALLVGIGVFAFLWQRHLLRRVLAFNVIGSGIFLYLGAAGARGGAADPVPHALIITGIVVALSASALAVALVLAHLHASSATRLPEDEP